MQTGCITKMFTKEDMKDTILGKISWRRCPVCEGTGFENWDADGSDIRSGRTGDPERVEGECENCPESIGYVVANES